MVEGWGLFVLGLVLLALGGDTLVKGVSGIAQRAGLSPFTAGLLLLAFGTSLPELFVNGAALLRGTPSLALGNAVGSNLVNLGLTLPLAALFASVQVRLRLLTPLLWVLVIASLLVMVFGLDGRLNRLEGGLLLLGFVLVVVKVIVRGRAEAPEVRAPVEAYAATRTVTWLNLLRLLIGVVLLGYGARDVVVSMGTLAPALGLTPLMAGLLPVAIGTALPEIAAAIAAARRGQGDMVLGHVIGSSVCNLLLVVGGMALIAPLSLPASFVKLELPAAIVMAIVLVPMLRGDARVSRGEAAVLLLAFCAWVALELAWLR
ncbi:sodium:calcium antiporter [Pseudoxanthomonas winnipegensis]|uniref:Sodium:calcium antiporter n=1 Tax=Pseudoxanthomonas winnipegensis TaxID=2480810 RepID=A0A4Q8LL90_9GAMM|nr:sodium:calcium antiporter [Pseudoxanthomonas winnipegensis]RZZ85148.1 sodium:calcium antiporter [Pseudoxanthomonas winnipegensis]TAA30937.1 sodium:calcium antiporter [Pseudoxanthomonas winnipegensis]TAA38707.1 sodium:calcium antiporter [Pseudoxanthomonas winnipegensis]TBV77740.1 sodium:calcium antiporter [Pseudoxanthomonas winnipegensis]